MKPFSPLTMMLPLPSTLTPALSQLEVQLVEPRATRNAVTTDSRITYTVPSFARRQSTPIGREAGVEIAWTAQRLIFSSGAAHFPAPGGSVAAELAIPGTQSRGVL